MIEEGLHEIGPAVLVIEVVGVLPYIAGQQGGLSFGQRVDGIWRGCDLELAAFGDEPAPTAAELAHSGRLELLLELVETTTVPIDRLRDLTRRRPAAPRFHAVPEERVVPHLGGVIENADP